MMRQFPSSCYYLPKREADDNKQFETATSSTDISLTVALLIQLVKHVYETFIEASSFSIQASQTLITTGEDKTDQLGALHFAARIIVSLTEL